MGQEVSRPEMEILADAKRLALEYRAATGKPLGITGEVAEFEAVRILGVELTAARQAGCVAIEHVNGTMRSLPIKGRCCRVVSLGSASEASTSPKQWDTVLMVLLDDNFDATAIYEADRAVVLAALQAPGSKSRNERSALAVSKFKSIARLRWRRE